MTKMFVLMCGGFQGLCYYKTREEAEEAARVRYLHNGIKWTVREVWC